MGFSQAYLTFRPHTNAILDLAFSPDDLLLATASGDQTAQVIDMPTQRTTYTMNGHTSSLKETCFQPGNSSVIATSSRDGSVQIWDLRCKSQEAPVRDLKVSLDPADKATSSRVPTGQKMSWARSVNTIANAHASRQNSHPNSAASNKPISYGENFTKTEAPGRRGDVSVTCLSFLQPGREHLLITGSAADASVKLWDLRTTHNHRRTRATPLSSTRQPESHTKYRHYGLNSLVLSGDGGRLYTLCRDNTVYTYSTSHLILGHAPELALSAPRPRRSGGKEKEGLAPIYGFRHPQFCATSFYVKCALRPAAGDRSEMLAVASSEACILLFPTDERYLQRRVGQSISPFPTTPSCHAGRHGVPQGLNHSTSVFRRLDDTLPIYEHGSPLVRGHSREVTGVTWTQSGDLVSVGDDSTARCWREGKGGEARELRVGGEGQGRRWRCGWAEVKEGWDDDDG
jgi:WD40 repeat protein